MTKEEKEITIAYLTKMQEEYIEGEGYERHPLFEYYVLDTAIKALEQEPSEDCVSRQAVSNTLFYKSDNNCEVVLNKELQDRIKALPSVTPTADVVERSKIDKAIEEIEKSFEPIVGTYNGDTPEYDRPLSRFNRNEGKKQALEILKRNIGK